MVKTELSEGVARPAVEDGPGNVGDGEDVQHGDHPQHGKALELPDGVWHGHQRVHRGQHEDHQEEAEVAPHPALCPSLQLALGLQVEVDRAVHGEEGHRERSHQQRIGVELVGQAAGVLARRRDGNAPHQVAHGHAEEQSRQQGARGESGVPEPSPEWTPDLAPELDRDGSEDQREEQEHEGRVEAREDRGVGLGKGGEHRAAERHQPHLVAVPQRTDGVEGDAAFPVAAGDEEVHHAHAQVEAVENGVARQQQAEQSEPDDGECLRFQDHSSCPSLGVSSLPASVRESRCRGRRPAAARKPPSSSGTTPGSSPAGSGPLWILSFST